MSFKKNTAVTGFIFHMVSSTDGSDITTGTPVGYYTLDGGVQTAIGDITPVHEGNGQWSVDLLAGEMNGDLVGLVFVLAGAITASFTIKTETKLVGELVDITAATVNAQCDLALADYDGPTNAEMIARTLLSSDYFNPATDTVANVTLVETTTANSDMRGTDGANTVVPNNAGITSIEGKIDAIQGGTFDGLTDSLEAIRNRGDAAWTTGAGGSSPTVEQIRAEIDLNSTKLISIVADTSELQTDWADGGRLDLLLDAIPTTPMRGTDNAALASEVTAARMSELDSGTVGKMANQIDVIQQDTTTDIPATINALNDFDPAADTVALVTALTNLPPMPTEWLTAAGIATNALNGKGDWNVGKTDYVLSAPGVDAIWDEPLGAHQSAFSAGRALSLGGVPIDETIIAGTPTATTITLTSGSSVDNFYADQTIKIVGGAALGQARIIDSYVGATKLCTFNEPLAITPSAGDAVCIELNHVHPTSQIAGDVWDKVLSDHNTPGSAGKAVADIVADTNELQADDIPGLIAALNDPTVAEILTTQMTESYAADGNAPTLAQALFNIQQFLNERSVAGTVQTVKRLDGTTAAMTHTLNDPTNPTSITRTT